MRRLLFICLLMGSAHAFAFDRLQVEGYTLPNGLQLLLKPGTERGHVAIRLVVGVGLDDFACEDKELPHLLEHLLFSGIDGGGEGDLEDRMQALGGEWNAYTSNADTTFVIEAPAQNQRKVLDLLLAIITRTELIDANINAAKQVVEREDGGHYSHLQRLLDRQDLGHTASNQLAIELGLKCAERAEVGQLTRDQLEDLRKHWYAPNNMTLIIVGDLDKLLPAYLERTYGQLDPVDPTEHRELPQIQHAAARQRELIHGWVGDSAKLHWLFPEPLLDDQHDETYDLLKDFISATNRIRMNLASALSSSTKALVENMRLRPAAGFMRLNLGAMLPAANNQPPNATGPISAANSKVMRMGCTARIAILPECSRYWPMAPGLSNTSRGKVKLSFISSIKSSAKPPP